MRNIGKIIQNDLRGLVRNKLAFVLALGVCVLPSLYAWFNIYSNWDPYGNTGNVSIAVASVDEGYTDEDGVTYNMGEQVIDGLRENNKINWVFLDTDTEAIEGVEAGDYYAAIVMGEDFSRSMYDFTDSGFTHPSVTYYENQKKNAIAAKITDSAKGTVQNNINEEFITVAMETVMESLNGLADDLEKSEYVSTLVEKLTFVSDNLQDYIDTLTALMECNEELSGNLTTASGQMSSAGNKVGSTTGSLNSAKAGADETLSQMEAQMDALVANTQSNLSDASARLSGINVSAADIMQAQADLDAAAAGVSALMTIYQQNNAGSSNEVLTAMKNAITTGYNAIADHDISEAEASAIAEGANDGALVIARAIDCVNTVIPIVDSQLSTEVANLKAQINSAYNSMISSLNSMNSGLQGTGVALSSLAATVAASNISFEELQGLIEEAKEDVLSIIERLNGVEESERYEELIRILSADPAAMGEFFASPVTMNTVEVYAIENYGSGVTPFYTILALWVGATILVSIIKVDVENREGLENVKPHELYFGRFVLFFLLGQIQTLIVVLGDLHLLGVQCLEPGKFYLTAVFASMTFNLFVYTMTVSFGDIGKAFAVIIMILQIAGSSGTYPIEILPDFYQNLYIYFPFPYAINAMRETIGGLYGNDYWMYMGQLGIFVIVALVIGLVVRRPFIHINHYVEKRMRDTKMM
jgi:putative membrane protein